MQDLASGRHNSLLCRMVPWSMIRPRPPFKLRKSNKSSSAGYPRSRSVGVTTSEQSLCDPLAKLCYVTHPIEPVNAE